MRCLITGASGHLGAAVVRRFVEAGWEVWGLVRPKSDLRRLAPVRDVVHLIRGDLTDLDPIAAEFGRAAPEVVVHAAWGGVERGRRDDADQMARNVSGSLRLLQLARGAGARCWVGIGSQAEYGPHGGRLREDMPPQPVSAYGIGKHCTRILSEKVCAEAGIRFVWFRLLASYGPDDEPGRLIPSTVLQLLNGNVPALTPGEQRWDYLYIEDAAEAIFRAATVETARGIFNLASGEAHEVRDIAARIRDLVDPGLALGLGAVGYPPGQMMLLEGDIRRLSAATGWMPRVGLDEGLRRTVEWYRGRRSQEADE